LYTAFLALEPNDTVKVCATCTTATSGGGSTAVKSIESKDASSDSLVQVFPNPFNSQTILQVRLPKGMTNQDVTFKIYNTLGQLIYTFNVSKLDDHHYEQFTWRGVTNKNGPIASGIYFAILSTPKGKYTSKLLMLK
jgi:hypothetical protein